MVDMIKVLTAKKETTYGTDAAPTLASNAILTRNFSSKPIEGDPLDRNLDRGSFGATPGAFTNQRQTLGFEVEIAGSGAAGTAPAWMELLEACGMAAPVLVASTSATQVPALPSVAASALTMYHWIGDQRRKALGARGTFGLDLTAGAYPFLNFNFTGLIPTSTPRDTNAPTAATLTRWKEPVEVNSVNTAVLLDGFAAPLRSLRLDANVQASIRNLVGSRYVNRGQHGFTGQLVVEAPAMASKDYLATLASGALVPLSIVHGLTAGNIITITCPKLQINDITESEEDRKLMWTMNVTATINAGADDLTIVAT